MTPFDRRTFIKAVGAAGVIQLPGGLRMAIAADAPSAGARLRKQAMGAEQVHAARARMR
jgi:hypothetical protein